VSDDARGELTGMTDGGGGSSGGGGGGAVVLLRRVAIVRTTSHPSEVRALVVTPVHVTRVWLPGRAPGGAR
jgi:hypothetical protein